MPTREEMLVEKTCKDQGLEPAVRIFYTLLGEGGEQQKHRTTKALSILLADLYSKNILSEDELDTILLECLS